MRRCSHLADQPGAAADYRRTNRPVEPLDKPQEVLGGPQEAMSVSSVRLFVERAIDAASNFELNDDTLGPVAAICRCLDGIPLALELAAVTLSTMTVEGLADAMNRRYEMLTCGSRAALPGIRHLPQCSTGATIGLRFRNRSCFGGSRSLTAAGPSTRQWGSAEI